MADEAIEIIREISVSTVSEYRRFPSARFYAATLVMLCRFAAIMVTISFAISAISWLPDIDFRLTPLLHHRSIVTHSILVPSVLFITLRRFAIARAIVAIMFAALSVHLFADAMSPPIGYGEIWIPPGGFFGLGVYSPIFIFVNAALALVIAMSIFPINFRSEFAAGVLLTGLLYGIVNEQSTFSTIFIVSMLAAIVCLLIWRGTINDTPWKIINQFREQRDAEIATNAEYASAERAVWQSKSMLTRAYMYLRMIAISIYTFSRWIVLNPRKVLFSIGMIFGTLLVLYVLGATGVGSSEGVFETVGNGVWKLHSSGGYMLTEDGKYIAGTLTSSPPD